ncbi:MAG: hypothetical protein AABX70_02305 [Nanoarchaeota archaeon]
MRNSLAVLVAALSLTHTPLQLPAPISPSSASAQASSTSVDRPLELQELRTSLKTSLNDLTYQFQNVITPLFHYGTQHPDKVRAMISCTPAACDFHLTFNGAAAVLPYAEDYENTRQNFLALYQRAETLGLPSLSEVACSMIPQKYACTVTDPLPRLIVLDEAVIFSLTRPRYECHPQVVLTGFSYKLSKETFLTVYFPSCDVYPSEDDALRSGYEVLGQNVKGLNGELLPNGLSMTFPPR